MKKLTAPVLASLLAPAASSRAQAPKAASTEFKAGEPLGTVNEAGKPTPMTSNVKVHGSFRFAESVTFDAERSSAPISAV